MHTSPFLTYTRDSCSVLTFVTGLVDFLLLFFFFFQKTPFFGIFISTEKCVSDSHTIQVEFTGLRTSFSEYKVIK